MNSLNRNPRIYTVSLIIPAETIIKKKNKARSKLDRLLERAILFPRKGIWRNTVTPIFHEITVFNKLRVTTFDAAFQSFKNARINSKKRILP